MCKQSIILKTETFISKAQLAQLDLLAKENPSIKSVVFDNVKQTLADDMYTLILEALKNNIADTTDITEDENKIGYALRVEIKSGLRYDVCDTSRVRENR